MVKTAKNNKKSKKNYSRKIIKRKKHMKKNKTFRKKKKYINLRTKTLKYRGGSPLQSNEGSKEIEMKNIQTSPKPKSKSKPKSKPPFGNIPSGSWQKNPFGRKKQQLQDKGVKPNIIEETKEDDSNPSNVKQNPGNIELVNINKKMQEIVDYEKKIRDLKTRIQAGNTMDKSKTNVIQNQKNEIKSLEAKLKIMLKQWQQQMKILQSEHSDMIGKIKQEANFKFIKEMKKIQTATVLANENNQRKLEEMEKKHANEIEGIKKAHDKQIKNIQTNQSQNIQTRVPPVSGFKQDVMTEYNMSESKDGQYKILTIKMYYPNNNKSTYSSLSVTGKKDQKPSTTKSEEVKSLRDIVKQAKIKSEELKTPTQSTIKSETKKGKMGLETDSGDETETDDEEEKITEL